MKLRAATTALAASVMAVVAPALAQADPANSDAKFYDELIHSVQRMVTLRAQENFPQLRLEALRACERITADGTLTGAINELNAAEPLLSSGDAFIVVMDAQDAYCPWTNGYPVVTAANPPPPLHGE